MERCLNVGNIMFSAITREAGCELVGTGGSQIEISNCYYDRQMSGYTDSERAMTTKDLTAGNVLAGFDAKVWSFTAGLYPRLASSANTDVYYIGSDARRYYQATDAAKLNAVPVYLATGETICT